MKTLLSVFLVLLCSVVQAQTIFLDDFEDGSLTNAANSSSIPASLTWSGNTGGQIPVNTTAPVLAGIYSLRSNTGNTPAAISAPFPTGTTLSSNNITWCVLYRNNTAKTPNDINAPVANYDNWRLWLAASSTNRTTCTGYFLTHKGSQLVLRVVTDQTTSAYDNIIPYTIADNTTYSIRLTRRADGDWKLYVDIGTGEAITEVGNGYKSYVPTTGTMYTMFDTNNTSGNANAFIWDNYQVSKTYLKVDDNSANVPAANLYTSDINKAIFSFKLTATEDVPLKSIYIGSSYGSLNDGKIKNNTAKLVQSDDDNFNTTADNVDITSQFQQAVVEPNAIKFYTDQGFTVKNNNPKYYFVVVDINTAFSGSGTPPPTTFSVSSAASSFQLKDNNKAGTNTYSYNTTQTFSGVYDWSGANSIQWEVNANWLVGSSAPAQPPGLNDVIRIGVNTAVTITNQPTVSDTRSCASITFGARPNNVLTVNGSAVGLTITGDMTVNHGNTATSQADGALPASAPAYKTVLAGTGTINVNSVIHGDNTFPPAGSTTRICNELSAEIGTLNINGNILLVANVINNTTVVNAPQFLHKSGNILLKGQFDRQVNGTYKTPLTNTKDSDVGYFATDASTGNTTLTLENLNAIKSQVNGIGIDFTNNGSGTATLVYKNNSTASQTIYPGNGISIGEDVSNYQNIVFDGSGPKLVYVNAYASTLPITINGSWTSLGGKIDLTTNNTTIQFEGSNQTLIDNGSDGGKGVVFRNVRFSGGGTKTVNTGNFAVAPVGTLTMAGATLNANGKLTLQSNATSSATVNPIPAGSSITNNINVERFVKGSPADLSKRGYRLLSSAVYTASPTIGGTPVRTYDPNYLLNNAFVSGLAGGGFNTSGNPSLYLYREDLIPTGVTFTSSNYKGIAGLSLTSPFSIRTQIRATTSYISDTTNVNIPIGTGMLFFFRGNLSDNNGPTVGTKILPPFNFPEDVVFTSTGIPNQGTVNVRTWYAKGDQTLLQYSTSIANDVSPRNVRGYHLLGNPYASSINWNKLNRSTTTPPSSPLYGPNIERTVWMFNPTSKQYGAYLAPATGDTINTVSTGTNGASNIIASGQGFFIRTFAGGSTFRFTESAKTIAQPSASSLNLLMGIPVSTLQNEQPYMHILMKKDAINDDDIIIRFDSSYTNAYSPLEDAQDMGGNGALVSLSALSTDKKTKIAIDGVPALSTVKSIPLFVDATTSGLYELHRKAFVGAADIYQVWLKDNFTKDSLDFRQNDTYTFRIDKNNTATFGDNRFELVFRKKLLPPYELLSFTAEKVKEGALLKWKVLNEFTYTQFSVQKADGSEQYISLDKMNSDGAGNYSFIDTKYSGEISSYRILQNKPDGTEAFSSVVNLKNTPQKQFAIYPNPAADYLVVELDTITAAKLNITDSEGRMILGTTFTGKSTRINISNIKAGSYFIEVKDSLSFKRLGTAKWLKL